MLQKYLEDMMFLPRLNGLRVLHCSPDMGVNALKHLLKLKFCNSTPLSPPCFRFSVGTQSQNNKNVSLFWCSVLFFLIWKIHQHDKTLCCPFSLGPVFVLSDFCMFICSVVFIFFFLLWACLCLFTYVIKRGNILSIQEKENVSSVILSAVTSS